MALEIKTQPANTVSVNNEMLFVIYEATKAIDPVTYPDYRYVLDLYVDSTLVGRLKSRPDPEQNMGIFDVSKILRGFASYGLDASQQVVDYTIIGSYRVKLGEEYGDTLYTNLLEDSTDRNFFETYKPKPFTSTSVLSNGLASNMPSVVYQKISQDFILVPFYSNVTGITDLVTEYFDKDGNSLGTDTVDNTDYQANKIRQTNQGVAGAGPDTIPGTEYAVLTGAGVSLRINFICDNRFETHTLAWLNPFGAYESFGFSFVSKKNIAIQRKEYEQIDYRINASGEVSYESNNVFYGGKKTFASIVKTKMKLTSHLLNESEYTWIADLFISPDVYFYDNSMGKFLPCRILSDNYEYKNYKNSKVTALDFEIEITGDYNSQIL